MAKDVHQWISSYGESHQNSTNKKIHWICVRLIMCSLIGLISLVKFQISNFEINLAHILILIAWVFYLRLSIIISIGMFIASAVQLFIIHYLEINLSILSVVFLHSGIFVLSWVGQFIGHKIEGQKPSFFEDLQFLLIGPAWLLSFIYRKLGIKY